MAKFSDDLPKSKQTKYLFIDAIGNPMGQYVDKKNLAVIRSKQYSEKYGHRVRILKVTEEVVGEAYPSK